MLIFVYGTLKEGFPNFAVNRGVRVAGEFRTLLALPLMLVSERHTPCLVWQPGQGFRITGQLFDADAAALAPMDELEGLGQAGGYERRSLLVVPAADDRGSPIEAQVYVKQPAQLRGQALPSGPHAEYTEEMARLYRRRSERLG